MSTLLTLATWLAGEFSNREQAFASPAWFSHIRLCIRPLPRHVFDGIGFYSEQADDYDWKRPYRVRVLQLIERDGRIESENFVLKDPAAYLGACREPERLVTLTRDQIEQLPGCTMVFDHVADAFEGRMLPGKHCRIFRKGQDTYLASEATVRANAFISWDRGLDPQTDEQVWGSYSGAFHFTKLQDFAAEVAGIHAGQLI